MKVILRILLILFFSAAFFAADSDSLKEFSRVDTVYLRPNDSTYVSIVKYPHQTWFQRNEGNIIGGLLGAFLAGLIAIISVQLTSSANTRNRIKREKEIYCGLLYALKIELDNNSNDYNNLIGELKVILQRSLSTNEIIADAPSRDISISFLQELRTKMMDTEVFNTKILLLISEYINDSELINRDIEFERLIKLTEKFKEQVDFPEAINSYFSTVIEQIENLEKSNPLIVEQINADLVSMGKKCEFDESEYLKVVS